HTGIHTKIIATERALDGDLPQTCRAETERVAFVANHPSRGRRQLLRLAGGPEQQMGIQQQLHAQAPKSLAMASVPMLSKSSGTSISPARKPKRFGVAGASSAVTFTRGLPALAITNGLPLAA